jgi:hypothetical protein
MGIFDRFKKKGTVSGEVVVRGLPPHKNYCVTITFFRVGGVSSPSPFDGDPPASEWIDTESVKEAEEPDDKPLRLSFQRTTGHYYIGVSAIAFMVHEGKLFAQVKRFFPMARPCEIRSGNDQQVQLTVL